MEPRWIRKAHAHIWILALLGLSILTLLGGLLFLLPLLLIIVEIIFLATNKLYVPKNGDWHSSERWRQIELMIAIVLLIVGFCRIKGLL